MMMVICDDNDNYGEDLSLENKGWKVLADDCASATGACGRLEMTAGEL